VSEARSTFSKASFVARASSANEDGTKDEAADAEEHAMAEVELDDPGKRSMLALHCPFVLLLVLLLVLLHSRLVALLLALFPVMQPHLSPPAQISGRKQWV
jgi:hypothetical protein